MLVFILVESYVIATATLIFVLYKINRAYKKYRYRAIAPKMPDDELPSVSVCLPARNESNPMSECLESVLASDYPKLEVIVLDDNSSDNTSNLVKAFAHSGVRFIPGDKRPSDWLGKNYALEVLLNEASGKYVLFMDVDTRLSVNSIRRMMEELDRTKSTMLSVIPQRYDTLRASTWFSTLRYFWELIFNSKVSPGSSSAAWLVNRRTLLDELGGFDAWRSQVQPEQHIAQEMAKTSEHRLVISTPELGVSFAKKWLSQIETSRRLLLPRFNNSFWSVVVGVGLLLVIVMPQVVIGISIARGEWLMVGAQSILGILATIAVASYCRLVWRDRWWIGVLTSPYVAWQEVVLLISSAIGYSRGTITWKGRVVERPSRKGHK